MIRQISALGLLGCALFVTTASAGEPVIARVVHEGAKLDGVVRGKYPIAPTEIGDRLLAYPPLASVSSPATVVFLHGLGGMAWHGCPVFRNGASTFGWLVCPEPTERRSDGRGFSWSSASTVNDRVVVAAERTAAEAGAGEPAVLVGFSQGSFVALDLLSRHPGKYRGAVFLSADIAPTKRDLGGVKRVVLGAGALDATFVPMQQAAARLRAEGVEVRFISLGRVGHTYVGEDPRVIEDALVWVGQA